MRCVDPVPYIKNLQKREAINKVSAIKTIKSAAGLEDRTMHFLDCFKHAEDLFIKIARGMM